MAQEGEVILNQKTITSLIVLVFVLAGGILFVHHSSRIVPHNPELVIPFVLHASPKGGGLRHSNHSFWGASGIRADDGEYHLYASRMGKQCGLEAWDLNSEIVRAVADHPLGPYQVVETVIPAMAHNPTVRKGPDGFYYLFYIGRPVDRAMQVADCKGGDSGFITQEQKDLPTPWRCQINVRQAEDPAGPWSESATLTVGSGRLPLCATNPAPLVAADGSLDLYYRAYRYIVTDDKSDQTRFHPYPQEWIYKVTSEKIGEPLGRFQFWPVLQGQGEDAFVWRNDDALHMIFNNKFNDKINMGGYARSSDGHRFERGAPIYSGTVEFLDGTSEVLNRRERPQIMWLDPDKTKGVLFQGARPTRQSDRVYTLATPIGNWTKKELESFESQHPFED